MAATDLIGSVGWHQLKELEIAQAVSKSTATAPEPLGGAAASGEGAVSVERRAVEEVGLQRKEAALAMERIAREQQLQLEESFAWWLQRWIYQNGERLRGMTWSSMCLTKGRIVVK